MVKEKYNVRVDLVIQPSMRQALEAEARRRGVKMSTAIRTAIRQYIEEGGRDRGEEGRHSEGSI